MAVPARIQTELTSLEHGFLKVPHEQVCRINKTSQAAVEEEMSALLGRLNALKNQGTVLSRELFANEIGNITGRLQTLKQRLKELVEEEQQLLSIAEARIHHLRDGMDCSDGVSWNRWSQTRLDRIIVDHLLRIGQYDVATHLAQMANIEKYVNLDIFKTSRIVEEALSRHDCSVALEWCSVNRVRLTKLKSTLEFKLRLQEYIELVRSGNRIGAIAYAKRYFKFSADRHMSEIQSAMALLLFSSSSSRPRPEKHKSLLADSRWEDLVQQFRRNNFVLHSLGAQSMMQVCLQSGLSALKNRVCYEDGQQSLDCPVCSPHMKVLAKELPHAHHVNSRLVCGMSGRLMNEDNPPMALPNGHVYSKEALQNMMLESNEIVCPRTKERYQFAEAQKVFIM